MRPRPLSSLPILLAAACGTVHEELSQKFLQPDPRWLAEPADLGLPAEWFELDVGGGASLTGWFLPNPAAGGRTVVVFHGNRANVSMLHPYYAFLHRAGFQVVVYDYRGFGRSRGEATIRGMVYDARVLLDWVRARPEVAADKIAWYGLSAGSLVALHAARTEGGCAAMVLENIPSPRDNLRAGTGTNALGAVQAGMLEFAGLPEGIEPDENAAALRAPTLFVCGAEEVDVDWRAFLRTYLAAAGHKQLHVLADTGHAPHSLLTHDGQYQQRIVEFLTSAMAGTPTGVTATIQPAAGAGGHYELALQRTGAGADTAPWAIEVGLVDADGRTTFRSFWLEGATGRFQLQLTNAPVVVSAMRVHDTLGTDDGGFTRQPSSLSRSGQRQQALQVAIDTMRKDEPSLGSARWAAREITAAEAGDPFHPLLEAELADVFAAIGRTLALAGGDDRAAGVVWLRRAVAAAPAKPQLHWWPGRPYVAGFQHEAAVQRARTLLAELGG